MSSQNNKNDSYTQRSGVCDWFKDCMKSKFSRISKNKMDTLKKPKAQHEYFLNISVRNPIDI